MSTNATVARARGKARKHAMQAIYQWQMTGDDIVDIKRQYIEDNDMSSEGTDIDMAYFTELVEGVHNRITEIDPVLEQYMQRKVMDVDPVERAIIRIATWEFAHRFDVPYRVVINEAVNMAKKFCAEKSHTFINAVLDKVAQELRALEINATQNRS